jgi:hypothetical protein
MSRTHRIPADTVQTQTQAVLARHTAGDQGLDFDPASGDIKPIDDIIEGMNARDIAAKGIAYFDPLDLIEEGVTNKTARALLHRSMLWSVQARLANKLRGMYFGIRTEARNTGSIDAFNEFRSHLMDAEGGEDFVRDLGYATFSEDLSMVRALHSLMGEYHSVAEQSAKAAGERGPLPQLEEVMSKPMPVDADQQKKMIMAVTMMLTEAGEDVAVVKAAEQSVRMKMAAEAKANAADLAAALPSLRAIHTFATSRGQSTGIAFHQLPIEMQVQMLNGLRISIGKCPDWMAMRRSVSVTDFALAVPELRRLGVALDEVLEAPRFAQH